MQSFKYTIKDPAGVHARPAGIIVQEAKKFKSTSTIIFNGKKADMKRIFGIMGLCIKNGCEVEVQVSGEDEVEASKAIEKAIKTNL